MRPEYNAVHGQLEPNSSAPSCVVTKNSILLVEYAIVARREGKSRFEALIDACHKRSRPIAMTTIAMGAGMLPLALGYGAAPMAIAVLGGLMTSKLLSLLVVPAVFTYVDDAKEWLTRVFQGASAFQLANALRCG